VAGLSDAFRSAGLRVFGPSREAAQLEGSKVFTKRLLAKYEIPSADFEVFQDFSRLLLPEKTCLIVVQG
jgi:phosphoribosylamine--glycine ligase